MNSRSKKTPRTPDEVARVPSLYQLRQSYLVILDELNECNRLRRSMESLAKGRREDVVHARRTIKKQNKEIISLTRSEQATSHAKKGATWSAASGVMISILYKVWDSVTGYPFGRSFEDVWLMPEVVAALTGAVGIVLAWAYKACHPESRD